LKRPGAQLKRTYSKSTGRLLMSKVGGEIQPAYAPGATTRPMSEATKARSSSVASHSPLRFQRPTPATESLMKSSRSF
jgi:hypothetical protein